MKTNIKTIAMAVTSALLLSTTGCSKVEVKPEVNELKLEGRYELAKMEAEVSGMGFTQEYLKDRSKITLDKGKLTVEWHEMKNVFDYTNDKNNIYFRNSEDSNTLILKPVVKYELKLDTLIFRDIIHSETKTTYWMVKMK